MTTANLMQGTAPATGQPWRLSARARKVTLVAHIAAGGGWLGMEIVLGVLVVTALSSGSDRDTAAISIAIAAFANWPLVVVGAITFATGMLLAIGSKFGLVRYWWVLAKIVVNLMLVTLVIVLLSPGVAELGSTAREYLEGAGAPVVLTPQILFPPIVASTAMLFAMTLGMFKPWGRISRTRT
jgi:hypothetical protein